MAYTFFDSDKTQDYLEELAHRHTDVNHNQEVADVKGNTTILKAFARHGSDAQMAAIKSCASPNVIVVTNIRFGRTGAKDDRTLHWEVDLRVASYASKTADTENEKIAAEKMAESIVFDLITEMELQQEKDLDQQVECGVMHFLVPEQITATKIQEVPWLLNHYGYDVTIPFNTWMAQHRSEKWRDPD